jgi:hypothetical protein
VTSTPVRSRRAAVLPRLVVGGAAAVVGLAGVGVAAGHALPGQPLYPVKTGSEHLQLDLTHGDASRGRLQLAFARTRLHEVGALAAHHSLTDAATGVDAAAAVDTGGRIAATLARMDAETEAGSSDLARAARGGDAGAGAALRTFAAVQRTLLAAVAPDLPQTASGALATSRTVLTRVAAVAASLPGASPATPIAPLSPLPATPGPSTLPTGPAGAVGSSPAPISSSPPAPSPTSISSATAPAASPTTAPAQPTAPAAPSEPPAPASSTPAAGPSGPPAPSATSADPTPTTADSSTPASPSAPGTSTSSPPAGSVTVSLAPLPPVAVPLPAADTMARPGESSWLLTVVLTLLRALSGR